MFNDELPHHLKIPKALITHPELVKRGLVLDHPLNNGSVYATHTLKKPQFVVKVLDPANEEEAIFERLRRDTSPGNHVIPCEIIRSDPVLLVMPALCEVDKPILQASGRFMVFCSLLRVFHQVVEGIDHLHRLHIAHLDIWSCNLMSAAPRTEKEHPRTKAGRVYIIDFDRSRQLGLGPGRHPSIELPSTHRKPPLQMTSFDPYSWDVYCMGKVFEQLITETYYSSPPPWSLVKLSQWVVGNERGCTGICHCRPTARRVLVVFTVIGWVVVLLEAFGKAFAATHGLLPSLRPPSRRRKQ